MPPGKVLWFKTTPPLAGITFILAGEHTSRIEIILPVLTCLKSTKAQLLPSRSPLRLRYYGRPNIIIVYSDRTVEISQRGTAEIENPLQPGQFITLTADIVLDIHKGWNFITDKTDYDVSADATPQSMSVTQRVVDQIPETAKWYYF
jgi:hypothetical protein